MPTRREVLATSGAVFATLAGCATRPPGTDTDRTPPDESPGGSTGDRPTVTPRSPDPLEVGGAWRQRGGGPGHAGTTDATGAPDAGRPHWHLRRVRSGPAVVADGRLFHYAKLGADRSGTPTLTRTRPPDAGTAHPIYGVPYLVARDAGEGRIQWATELPSPAAGWPAVGDGVVVASSNGWLRAFDAGSGDRRWSHDLGDHPVGEPTVVGDAVVVPQSGVVDGGSGDTVEDPVVRAYDLADGSVRWTATMPKRGLSLAVAGGAVVVVSHDYDETGAVVALSLSDGTERWRTEVDGGFFAGPVVADDTAFVADGGGGGSSDGLGALSLADGTERWRVAGGGDGIAADTETVYAAGGEGLVARDAADGSERWRYAPGAESFVAPAVGGDVVYAGGGFAGLAALAADDGSERWSHTFPTQTVEGDMIMRGPQSQPAVVDGAVYVFAADGLYAFGSA
jgi:outer membrane protein assembly factor BamB